MKVIVTGGTGYIGSHTIVDLQQNGFDVVCIDNLSRSKEYALEGIEAITGKRPTFHYIDLCNKEATLDVIAAHQDAVGIIHFAALKSVPESVEKPLLYYHNNIDSLLNILYAVKVQPSEFCIFLFLFGIWQCRRITGNRAYAFAACGKPLRTYQTNRGRYHPQFCKHKQLAAYPFAIF